MRRESGSDACPADVGWPAVTRRSMGRGPAAIQQGFARALALADDEGRTSQPIAPPLEFDHLTNTRRATC